MSYKDATVKLVRNVLCPFKGDVHIHQNQVDFSLVIAMVPAYCFPDSLLLLIWVFCAMPSEFLLAGLNIFSLLICQTQMQLGNACSCILLKCKFL
uniref:Uncharacterized protein n=1 Tax=Rhizophora mucronata TaxID=61149 RepID=A0A2P2N2U2_RHIMU